MRNFLAWRLINITLVDNKTWEELLRPNHNLSLFTVIPVDFQLSYLLTMAVITAIAFAPYAIFILFTCYCKVLFQPKNIIKCNFAIATLIFLTGNLIHLLVLYFEFGSFCPDIYLLWWSSTSIIMSVFLIEFERFLAIRFPLSYTLIVTDTRSIIACITTQFGALGMCIVVRLSSPRTFSCLSQFEGDLVINRTLFIYIVVVPYFICFILSLVCSLYVVKVMLKQTRRTNRIHSTTLQLSTIQATRVAQLESLDTRELQKAVLNTCIPEENEEELSEDDVQSGTRKIPQDTSKKTKGTTFATTVNIIPISKRFSERSLSYPLEDSSHLQSKFGHIRETILKLRSGDKDFAGGTLQDLKRDLKSTIKTLSMLFVYLGMSSPWYVIAVMMFFDNKRPDLKVYGFFFFHISYLGHLAYPYMWLLNDKMFKEASGLFQTMFQITSMALFKVRNLDLGYITAHFNQKTTLDP